MNPSRWTLLALFSALVLTLFAGVPAALAQSTNEPTETAEPNESEETGDGMTRRELKQTAKERRIDEYLRKRQAKLDRKEATRTTRESENSESAARELESQQLSGSAPSQDRPTQKSGRNRSPQNSELPRDLARAQENVRGTTLGEDPTVREYLALIEQQQASALQLAAFGNFLAQNGLVRDALEYYEVALRLEDRDPVLWINSGTLHQQLNDLSTAASAYSTALSITPNNALAHYNLGSVLNEMNRYEDALAEYKAALVLDPSLGDPAYNPQATNNTLLTAVKLMLYQEQVGSLSLPLIEIPTGVSE